MCDHTDARFAELLAQQSLKMSKFARRLAGSEADAEDLFQDTLMRCWSARHTFEDGTSLGAWVITVMRNGYISGARRAWRMVTIESEILDDLLSVPPSQEMCVILKDATAALGKIPMEQRAAILLAAEGYSMEEASRRAGVSVGAFKSRLMRARFQLRNLTEG